MTFAEMKRFEDKLALLKCADGEVIKAKVLFVDEEYADVILDVASTSKMEKWQKGHPNSDAAYVIPLAEIEFVQEIS